MPTILLLDMTNDYFSTSSAIYLFLPVGIQCLYFIFCVVLDLGKNVHGKKVHGGKVQ